jgi:acyl-CoA synthetase (AMP-forming)/AMP-acid ligase II
MASSPDLFLDRMAQNAANSPNKTAVTFLSSGPNGGKVELTLTYSELAKETTSLASRLLESGLSKGDRAVLVYPPSLDYMVAFLACLKAGIVAVPVFPPNPARQETLLMFSRIVDGCGAAHALTSVTYNYMKKLASIGKRKQWPSHLLWIVTNDGKSPKKTFEEQPPSSDDLAFLQYTSGSTSDPKGVMITHGNLSHNLTIITQELCAREDTVVVSWLPQYHDMGLIGSYLGVLYCGGSGYYMSPLSFLQRPMLWMEAVSKYHATHLQAPNFAFKLTARKSTPEKLDLSSVRHVINGAEPVDENSVDSFYEAFGKFGLREHVIFPTYGLAEHTVFVCSGGKQRLSVSKPALEVDGLVKVVDDDGSNSNSSDVSRLVGCGFPDRQGVDVKIVNTDTHEVLDENTVGEIWIQSPSKAAGYFGKPEQSIEDFHAQLKGGPAADGYLRSGDLGFLHNEELFICGRLKDLIIVGGRNYYPQDIEATAEASSELLRPGCSAAFTIDPTHEGGEEVALVAELREVPNDKVCLFE